MRKLIVFIFMVLIINAVTYAHAAKFWPATSLTGGGSGALDAIDGSGLTAGDGGMVVTSASAVYFYVIIDDSAAESSPSVIAPDTNAGTHRWHLVTVQAAAFAASASTAPTQPFWDSDAPGTDKEIAKLVGGYVDGADGSENGTLDLNVHEGGTTTAYLKLNGKLVDVEIKKPLVCESTVGVATSLNPDAADGATLGTTSLEWSDAYFADGAVIYGQADQSNTLTSSATAWTFGLDVVVGGSDLTLNAAGVKLTGDGDGALTILGLGDGYDEDLTINLDDTENTAKLSSSTGVTAIDFSALNLTTTGTIRGRTVYGADVTGSTAHDTTATHNVIYHVTAAATITLDAAADAGYGATVSYRVRDAAEACLIETASGEKINLNGTALATGTGITATGVGKFVTLVATTDTDASGTDGWEVWGNNGFASE